MATGNDDVPLAVSRNQLDRAGSRVRRCAEAREPVPEQVLATINEFRGWHLPVLQDVQQALSDMFHKRAAIDERTLPITSRLKTSAAIIAKLARSETSLPRMQDIAGARIVIPTLDMQDSVVRIVESVFRDAVQHVKDQREEPDQWGYRAVHVIVKRNGRLGEVQVRTLWQDRWAQVVERLDGAAPAWDLKHGRGPAEWLEWLHVLSDESRKADLGEPYNLPAMPFDQPEEGEGA